MQKNAIQSKLHAIEGSLTAHQRIAVTEFHKAHGTSADLIRLGNSYNVATKAVTAFGEADRNDPETRIRSLWMLRDAIPRVK